MPEHKDKNTFSISIPSFSLSRLNLNYIMIGILIISSFFIGSLYTKVQYLEKNGVQNAAAAPQAAPPQAPQQPSGPIEVSVDDDPILGDENAPVTLVEFSDYECPFCKKYFDETLAQIKTEYIDTGKVKVVYRDFPLSFHDPMATKEAIAANCARDQGDDSTYFTYHDEIFKRTTSNRNGLSVDKLHTIASDLGLNADDFKSCLDSDKYKDEVQKDIADGTASGANATPTFFIGKSDGDVIKGIPIIGAQPFTAFKTAIDEALK